jgi:DNA-binding SARP family transcriptional activator
MEGPTPDQLEIAAHGVTAILATWLGLTVVTRAGRRPGAAVFGLLCLYLVAWSVSIVVERLTNDPSTLRSLGAVEDLSAFLLPAGTLHIALTLAVEGRRTLVQQAVLVATYLVCGAMAVAAVLFPDQKFSVTPPHFELPSISGEFFGWAWIGARVAIFVAALLWIGIALGGAGRDRARRRQLVAALATVGVGALGGVIRFLPGPADSDPWIGVSLVTVAMVLAAYGVFAQGVFLAPEVAGRAFRYSVITGLAITLYVTGLIGLERLADRAFGIDLPIVTGLALVVTIALFDPIADRMRRLLGGPQGDAASERLLRALGQDILTAQRPERAIEPALARLERTFGLRGTAISDPAGELVADHGQAPGDDPLALRIPLRAGDEYRGTVTFGPKRSQLPFTQREVELLSLAAAYVAASLRLAEQHEVQAEALTALQVERANVATRETALSDALTQVSSPTTEGLHIFALGPLRAERNGTPLHQWGGAKAGTRQAEAVFAFLLDRGERGAAKDEMIELIWPDVDLERADLAFHRTLGGLRSTLEPGRPGRDRGAAIAFRNDRYRLDPAVVQWSDMTAFEEGVAAGSAASDPIEAVQHLERARSLYRGDYLDDCPFYGDSSFVEERRELLRGRMVDLLLILSDRYLKRDDRAAAAACLRQANLVAGEELPTVTAGLTRLGSSA